MGNLIKEYYNSNDLNLLLPGFVPPRFLSELYKDYSKIFILNYDGFNRKNILQQIDSIENPSIVDETKVMDYFLELFLLLGIAGIVLVFRRTSGENGSNTGRKTWWRSAFGYESVA